MSMRRFRVKATANLANVKRKPRQQQQQPTIPVATTIDENNLNEDSEDDEQNVNKLNTEQLIGTVDENDKQQTDCVKHTAEEESVAAAAPATEQQLEPEALPDVQSLITHNVDEPVAFAELKPDIDFKMPASTNNLDDVFHSDIEDNVIQMDLMKSIQGYPMSPSKAQGRQRVRPTPVFGQRRNSFVCASPSPHTSEIDALPNGSIVAGVGGGSTPQGAGTSAIFMSPGTPQRRERYYSGSSTHQSQPGTPQQQFPQQHKYFPGVMSPGMGRVRTESSCSAFSDSMYSVSGKTRKNDEQKQQNHRINARRDFEARFKDFVPDKSTFRMFDLIFYNPASNPMEQKPAVTTIKAETASVDAKLPKEELSDDAVSSAMPVPQLKLNANGEMIIDEKTLEIETTAEQEARKVLANSSLILMDENTGMNGFYRRQKRTRGWSSEETVRFYRALQIVGTDFTMMCELFKNRTRRDLKLKYKKEERINDALISKALLNPKAFNIEELKAQLEQEDREREEAEQMWREIKKREAEQFAKISKEKPKNKTTSALSNGDFVLNNEHVPTKKMGKRALKAARVAAQNNLNDANDAPTEPKKRRRQRQAQQLEMQTTDDDNKPASVLLPPFASIKQETNIKMENQQYQNEDQNTLEMEINELLEPTNHIFCANIDVQHQEQQEHPSIHVVNNTLITNSPQHNVILEPNQTSLNNVDNIMLLDMEQQTDLPQVATTLLELSTIAYSTAEQSNETINDYEIKTSIITPTPTEQSIMENSTQPVSSIHDIEPPLPADDAITEENLDADLEEHEVSESDIQQILTLLAEGALALVSTLDPDNEDKVIHAIYEMDPKTNKLCDDPLDIPESIVQCILAVMS